jgi:hypothetical protein
MDLFQLRTLISAFVLTIHVGLAHIEEEQCCLEEFDRLLLEYGEGQARFCMEVNACVNVGALYQLQCLNSYHDSIEEKMWWVKSRSIT